jgi:hypothetical protein
MIIERGLEAAFAFDGRSTGAAVVAAATRGTPARTPLGFSDFTSSKFSGVGGDSLVSEFGAAL